VLSNHTESLRHTWKGHSWELIKEFGNECFRTWRGEVMASALVIGFIFLINRNAIDLRMALLATAYTLATMGIWHFLRIPWLLFKRIEEREPKLHAVWGIIGIGFASGSIALWLFTAVWFYTMQPHVDLSKRPDGRDERILQLRQQLDALKEPEPPDSLRHRTAKAADELYEYIIKRAEGRPQPDAWPNSSEPTPSPERQAAIKRSQKYAQETEDYYMKHFRDRMVGIIKEYEMVGVHTRYLENDFRQRIPYIQPIGSDWEGSQLDQLTQFRDLAYHVDGHGHLIVF